MSESTTAIAFEMLRQLTGRTGPPDWLETWIAPTEWVRTPERDGWFRAFPEDLRPTMIKFPLGCVVCEGGNLWLIVLRYSFDAAPSGETRVTLVLSGNRKGRERDEDYTMAAGKVTGEVVGFYGGLTSDVMREILKP